MRFSLLCDLDGRVETIMNDEDHLLPGSFIGNMFFTIVVPGDLNKILNFFLELKTYGNAIGWEINLALPSGPATFSFFGGLFDGKVGLAAANSTNGAEQLFNEVNRISNEQVNIIRQVTKENAQLQSEQKEPGVLYYEELSRLNNEMVNMQRELAKKNRELDGLNSLKNQFLGIAAHDLRSPLGVILSYSELMLDSLATLTPEESADLLQRIQKTGKFMLGLVNDLLDIANIESGQLELDLTDEDLNKVILENIEMNSLFSRSKSIRLSFIPPDIPVRIRIDRPKIDQVLTNLISNAIKYSYPESDILILAEYDAKRAKVTVRDSGQGIREAELGKIFKPFQKTSTRSTSGEKSTGLGLAIVKKIIDAHGGEIGVFSIFGRGSEFFFYLPLMNGDN